MPSTLHLSASNSAAAANKLQLSAGNMKLTVKANEVRLIEDAEMQEKKAVQRRAAADAAAGQAGDLTLHGGVVGIHRL